MFMIGSNFFQNLDSFVLLNFLLQAKAAAFHLAQILRSQHMIALEIPVAYVRLVFFLQKSCFRFWSFPCHAPALEKNHICNMLPLGMCLPFTKKTF